MIDKINVERHDHILTIEDPIEYIHPHKSCLVNQREVHSDYEQFLQRAARRSPRGSRHRPHRRNARPGTWRRR
jgi:twitching motility protein PilT